MKSHEPGMSILQAAVHYMGQGSPLVVVTELAPYDDAMRINAFMPDERPRLEAMTSFERLGLALLMMVAARRAEGERL